MSLWSGISNLFHGIGDFFTGHDDEEERKRQQSQVVQPNRPASTFNAPNQNVPAQTFNQPEQPSEMLNLFQGNLQKAKQPGAQTFNNNQTPYNEPLQKAAPKPQTPAPTPTPAVVQDNLPQAGDTQGLIRSLKGFDTYTPEDQVRILQRSSKSGLIAPNVSSAYIDNILSPTRSTDRSKWGMFGEALGRVLLPGYSIYKQIGTTLGANKLYDEAAKGRIDPSIVQNTVAEANAENGGLLNEYSGIDWGKMAGAGINESLKAASLGTGSIAANTLEKGIIPLVKQGVKTGVKFGVAGGTAQTLSGDNLSPTEWAKNILTNTAEMTALGLLPVAASTLRKARVMPDEIEATRLAQTAEEATRTAEVARGASEIAPGVKAANAAEITPTKVAPPIEMIDDLNTPAYMRRTPETVGQAADRYAVTGETGLPDKTFSADARAGTNGASYDPFDSPTFLRKTADVDRTVAIGELTALEDRINSIQENTGRIGDFKAKQAIAEAYKQGAVKGQATAKLVAAKRDMINPEKELVKALGQKQEALKKYNTAVSASKDQAAIDAMAGGRPVEVVAHNTPEAPSAAPTVPTPLAAAEEVPVAPVVPETVPTKTAVAEIPAPTAVPAKATRLKKAPQSELPASEGGGIATTGETGRSTGKYAPGQEYERTSLEASREQGAKSAANTSYEKFVKDIEDKGSMNTADRDTAVALQQRYRPGTVEHRRLGDMVNKYHTESSQTMATIERTLRKTADAKQLADRFANKLYASLDDSTALNEEMFKSVIAKNEDFVAARDARDAALERFNNEPSETNMKAFVEAQKRVEDTDRAAKFTEYDVAAKAVKGNKNPKSEALIKQLEEDAGVYTMSAVNSSLLSSTRVMLNNYLNTLGVGLEERMFGKAGARLAKAITGETIGGGSRAGRKLGQQIGLRTTMAEARLRQGAHGNKLMKAIKNVVTTGNTLGDRNVYGTAYAGVYDHYYQDLKRAGYSGDELKHRTLVQTLADPDNIAFDYTHQSLVDNALSSTLTGKSRVKLETWLTDTISHKLGNSGAARVAAETLTRVGVGFPTVIARSAVGGLKRSTLGFFEAGQAVKNAVTHGPKETTALHIKNAVKQFGAGATMVAVGAALGSQGLISGSWPTDKDEQEAWKREGKTDHAIKIGGNWYSLPAVMGVFALPFMIGANAGENVRAGKSLTDGIIRSSWQTVLNATPIDTLDNSVSFLSDMAKGRDTGDFLPRAGSSVVRALTPAGSFVNEIAKIFDPTANDTTKGEAINQFLAKVQDGIPGLSNKLPDKKVEGNVIKNPPAYARVLGSSSAEQKAGVAQSAEIKQQVNDTNKRLADFGVFTDGVRNILDDTTKDLFDTVKSGKEIDEGDLKKLTDAVTKNISESEDTRFLEDGDYDSNLAVLKTKLDTLQGDPTIRRDTLKGYEVQIKRGEVYKDKKTPYDLISKYKETSLTDWRDMGDPESDGYNPKLYQELYALDSALAGAGASRSSKGLDQNKYYAAKEGSGRGGSGASRVKSNTVDSTPDLKKINFGALAPQKAASAKIPVLQKIPANQLIKKRTISVR